MHEPKPTIDTDLARRLVDAQFPQWRHLPVKPVAFGGWDNRTFHLGDEMTVRLPSAAPYSLQVEKEHLGPEPGDRSQDGLANVDLGDDPDSSGRRQEAPAQGPIAGLRGNDHGDTRHSIPSPLLGTGSSTPNSYQDLGRRSIGLWSVRPFSWPGPSASRAYTARWRRLETPSLLKMLVR